VEVVGGHRTAVHAPGDDASELAERLAQRGRWHERKKHARDGLITGGRIHALMLREAEPKKCDSSPLTQGIAPKKCAAMSWRHRGAGSTIAARGETRRV